MPKYQCKKCSYKFEKSKKPSICPYCGETNTVRLEPTAQDFLEEVKGREKKQEVREEAEKSRF